MSDYKQLIEKQRAFFATGKTRDTDFRIEQLNNLRRVVADKHKDIENSLYKDLHKCEFESFATEITAVIDEINSVVENLATWTKPVPVASPPIFGQAESTIFYEPFGIVLIINTWNYPFVLCFKQLIGALAAGNCCIVKTSEVAQAASKALADVINSAFDANYCAAIECGVEGVTELLQERFDFITYTGNTTVGRVIAQAAAKHLTPTVLELGGKSPCIVDQSADIERSIASICWGKFINAGQTCTAPDYLWVHKSLKDSLIAALKNQIGAFYGNDIKNNPEFGRIVNRRHFDRLKNLLNEGNIVCGGETDETQLYISPTVIDGITWENKIMQDEIFGPILPVMTFDSLDEVAASLSQKEKPLALYLYTTDKAAEELIINRLSFGGGCVNATLMQMLNTQLPFGGIGASGHGFYQGRWGIETFSHKKSLFNRALSDEPSPMFPPYDDKVKMLKQIYLGE